MFEYIKQMILPVCIQQSHLCHYASLDIDLAVDEEPTCPPIEKILQKINQQ